MCFFRVHNGGASSTDLTCHLQMVQLIRRRKTDSFQGAFAVSKKGARYLHSQDPYGFVWIIEGWWWFVVVKVEMFLVGFGSGVFSSIGCRLFFRFWYLKRYICTLKLIASLLEKVEPCLKTSCRFFLSFESKVKIARSNKIVNFWIYWALEIKQKWPKAVKQWILEIFFPILIISASFFEKIEPFHNQKLLLLQIIPAMHPILKHKLQMDTKLMPKVHFKKNSHTT
jgi:hypothetical protein